MNIALWIASGALALFIAAAGFVKTFRPISETRKMPWTSAFTDAQIRLIGTAELLGALGLILPAATGILPILSGVAALCIAILMAGATRIHKKINDPNSAAVTTTALMVLAILVAVGRFAGLA